MKTTAEGALIAREGYPFIAIAAVFTAICGALAVCPGGLAWVALTALGVLLLVWVVWFFRNPARTVPAGEGLVVAPADGRVLGVDFAPYPDGSPARRVCIFMNVFNVHVNRLPVTGRVTAVNYIPGRFFNASFDKASEHNERNALTMRTADGHSVHFVQIAGLVARRIVCWGTVGTEGRAGDIFGLIRFGSRVDVYLPPASLVLVEAGQRVTAGETVLGRLPGTLVETPAGS
ncbi:MAG: phosphatidylserine decarboxylase family protein [Nitrospirota bacterium]|nr:phosphatidylserine decarboxylase family protein [Nitrospirota bacterium]